MSIDQHVSETVVARTLEIKVRTVRNWRLKKIGPPYCKFGRAVRYPVTDLAAYVEAAKVQSV